jgi:hypothetical protein
MRNMTREVPPRTAHVWSGCASTHAPRVRMGRTAVTTHAGRALVLSVLACTALAAAEFWDEKPFSNWSDREITKILTDSPWARTVTAPLPPQIAPGGDAGGRGGRGGGDDFGPGPRRVRLTISWRSALPVKQALVRRQAGTETLSADQQAFLTQHEPFYVVGVLGIPLQFGRTPLESVLAESELRRDRRPPIPAEDVTLRQEGTALLLLVAFPRGDDAVTLDDREVEFVTKLGDFRIQRKFRLRDMVFDGMLTL